ncbi:hypothetical protein LAZ67_2006681 [Cordylochernes scorpioides]|uniref:MATH domain-containing protein n=1 Tax=Cordylochernes scorpioides TaxID=51811 RepID=A0ABY6K5L4_9ARAC|nr:hypothetical protein LAZ67_2006681 [Cordylochernes scorpioides]
MMDILLYKELSDEHFANLKEIDNGSLVAEYEWRVPNIGHLLELSSRGDTIPGPEFYTGRPGYRVRLGLTLGRTRNPDGEPHLGVWFALVKGRFDDVVEWPFQYRFNLTLVDQAYDGGPPQHIHLTMNPLTAICRLLKQFLRPRGDKPEGDGCGKALFVPHRKLLLPRSRFVLHGGILIRVTIFLEDPPVSAVPKRARAYMRGHQLVSEFLWDIEDMDAKIRKARDGLLSHVTSDLFYVNSESYLMVLQLAINPEDEHLGLFATLVPGDFDETLEWPFSYTFELSIVDQTPGYLTLDRKGVVDPTSGICALGSFTKPQYQPNVPCGFRRLVSFQLLESKNFKKNGRILVKFTAILDKMPNFASVSVKESHLVAEFFWRVPNIERKVQLAKSGRMSNLLSERFYTGDQGYLIQLQLKFQNDSTGHIGLYLTLLEGEYDSLIEWPFSKKFELIVLDQQPSGAGRDIAISVDPRNPYITNEACVGSFWRPVGRNDACGSANTVAYDTLYSQKYIRYGAMLVKATIFLEEIQPPRFASLSVDEGNLVARYEWKVPDIDDKIGQAKKGDLQFLDSEKFYVSNNGYRMMLRLYPEKSPGYLGLYAVLTKGAYDAELDWPFKLKYQLTIVGTKGEPDVARTTYPAATATSGCPSAAFRRPEQELAEWSCGEGRMLSHATLTSQRGYVGADDNAIRVRVDIFLAELAGSPTAALVPQPEGRGLAAEYAWLVSEVEPKLSLLRTGELTKLESALFYTGPQGYAARLSLAVSPVAPALHYLAAHGGQEHVLGLYLTLFRGRHDPLLRWPFPHVVHLTLADPDHAGGDLVKTIDPRNTKCPPQAFDRPTEIHNEHSCGFAALVSLERVKNFINDDPPLNLLQMSPEKSPDERAIFHGATTGERVHLRTPFCNRFFTVKNETAVNIHRNLVSVYGEGCMSIQMVRRWRSWFLEGRQNVHDDERSGRPVTATDNAAVAAVRNVVEADRRVTLTK